MSRKTSLSVKSNFTKSQPSMLKNKTDDLIHEITNNAAIKHKIVDKVA